MSMRRGKRNLYVEKRLGKDKGASSVFWMTRAFAAIFLFNSFSNPFLILSLIQFLRSPESLYDVENPEGLMTRLIIHVDYVLNCTEAIESGISIETYVSWSRICDYLRLIAERFFPWTRRLLFWCGLGAFADVDGVNARINNYNTRTILDAGQTIIKSHE
jgi:hypothetical protein